MTTRRRMTRAAASAVVIALGSLAAAAAPMQEAPPPPAAPPAPPPGAENAPAGDEITPELEAAIQRGFAYLVSQQNRDGSFGRGRYGRHVGITALCAIAFMADGNLPGRGPYGEQVERALEFVISNAGDAGLLAADTSHGPMYGHGFATLFLGEIYGMNPTDDRVREALQKAVDLIVGSQNELGGWRYNPVPLDADVSVTVCQVMALRSARNAGIKVPRETIDRAIAYIRSCQNDDGGFRYMSQPGVSAWPRTAAGVATLFYAGVHEDDSIDRGLSYLTRVAMPGQRLPSQAHYYYGHYYSVQAMYLAGGEWWSRWWPAAREELLSRQHTEGGWLDHYAGGAYSTAMSLIVLQMPKRYLPIFQR
ncbi:MAG: prenyltransferase/squalene oxidase repeat-containing protein [Planctomycetota bacterium]